MKKLAKILIVAVFTITSAVAETETIKPEQVPVPKETMQTIRALAAKEYPDSYSMQAYIIDREVAAFKEVMAWGFNNRDNKIAEKILIQARLDYPDNYSMQWYIVQREVEALNKIYGD